MKEKLRFLGLDVHAETIAVAIAEPDGEVRSLGTIPEPLGIGTQADQEAGSGREESQLRDVINPVRCSRRNEGLPIISGPFSSWCNLRATPPFA
jgi:hypothetical protein